MCNKHIYPSFFILYIYESTSSFFSSLSVSTDLCRYLYCKSWKKFFGWGIHLFTGRFGASKTSSVVYLAYKLAKKYPQLHILTNVKLDNFPKHTKILKLETAQDILNAPPDTLCIIDEIGTIFNSRDFSTGKTAVPKSLYQHLCQCRKRRLMIYGTVQRYNLLDKQIRDVSADVTTCATYFKHPFSRLCTMKTYDIEEFEAYSNNKLYRSVAYTCCAYVQRNLYRYLYDTSELITGMLNKEYLEDKEILSNREVNSSYSQIDKSLKKSYRKRKKFIEYCLKYNFRKFYIFLEYLFLIWTIL